MMTEIYGGGQKDVYSLKGTKLKKYLPTTKERGGIGGVGGVLSNMNHENRIKITFCWEGGILSQIFT